MEVVVLVAPLTVAVVPEVVELAAPDVLVVVVVPVSGTAVVPPDVEVPIVPVALVLAVVLVVADVVPPPLVALVDVQTWTPFPPTVQPLPEPVLAVFVEPEPEPDPDPEPDPLPVPVPEPPGLHAPGPAAAAASGGSAVDERTEVVRLWMSSEITTGSFASTFLSANAAPPVAASAAVHPNITTAKVRPIMIGSLLFVIRAPSARSR